MGKLFGSSGVRGLANVDLTPLLACKVGLAVATYAKAKKVVVARDTRVSGLHAAGRLGFGFAGKRHRRSAGGHGSDTHFSLRYHGA